MSYGRKGQLAPLSVSLFAPRFIWTGNTSRQNEQGGEIPKGGMCEFKSDLLEHLACCDVATTGLTARRRLLGVWRTTLSIVLK